MCKPKEYGGTGIKDVDVFDRAMLTKWLWRFIKETNAFWRGILEYILLEEFCPNICQEF